MPTRDDLKNIVPSFGVKVNGRDLADAAKVDLISVAVHEDVALPGMFTVQFMNGGMAGKAVTWSDSDLFEVGNEVEIQMGYVGNLKSLICGDVTGLEPEFCPGEIPLLTVRGYDCRHRLMRGRHTRSFIEMKDSQIVDKIAGERGLSADTKDSTVTLDYVLQNNQTDMDFLNDRALRIGYEVMVEGKKLIFRPRQNSEQAVLILDPDLDLIEFYPRLNALGQVGQTEVYGWDPAKKEAILAQATAKDVSTKMGGSLSGPAAGDKGFKSASLPSVRQPVSNKAEADQIAKGQINSMALAYVSGEGICIGCPDLRAGKVIKIEGLGKRFSGLYYVTSTEHAITPAQGYRTNFTVKRNAT